VDRPAFIALIGVGCLLAGGGIGYAVGNSGETDGATTIVGQTGATGEGGATNQDAAQATDTETDEGTEPETEAAPTGETVVLKGDSDQVFPQETYSGNYEVTWSFDRNSAPYLDVYGQKKPNPGGFGKEVLSTEAAEGTSIVNLEGEYYMYVEVGGKNYEITLEPSE
jgi:hypothetical protein